MHNAQLSVDAPLSVARASCASSVCIERGALIAALRKVFQGPAVCVADSHVHCASCIVHSFPSST